MLLIPNKKKGSRLKPDAPIFVPCSPSTSIPTTESFSKTQSKEAAKESSKARKHQEREERKAASLAKKAGKKAAEQVKTNGIDPRAPLIILILTGADSARDLDEANMSPVGLSAASGGPATNGDISATEKPRSKRVRFPNKRQLTKSEPASRALESLDGQQDSDITTAGSSEGQPIVQPSPAVSSHFILHFDD